MVGINAKTGQPMEEPEHIKQSIDKLLRTPKGTRVMRRDLGYACLNEDGTSKSNLTKEIAEAAALDEIGKSEPRIKDVSAVATLESGRLTSIDIAYTEIKTGNSTKVTVITRR